MGAVIETGLYVKLKADTAVTALIGAGDNARLWPNMAPEGTDLPYITFSKISGNQVNSMAGVTTLANPVLQVNVYDDDHLGVKNLAELVRLALDYDNSGWGTVDVRGVIMRNDVDIPELSPGLEEARVFGVAMDFEIWHTQAAS